MTFIQSIILGIVQGLTEFIPVSSSGHLIIARQFLSIPDGGLAFDAVLQLATSFAVLLYFWKDIKSLFLTFLKYISNKSVSISDANMFKCIIIGTIPAVILGILLENYMETTFRSVFVIILTLVLGSILMYMAELYSKRKGYDEPLSVLKALNIGLFQCLALLPGMSRSGSTISGGLFSGLSRENAIRFSFLLSFPILFGTGFKKLGDILHTSYSIHDLFALALGSITAFFVGLIAIHFLITYLRKNSMKVFVWYRIVLAIVLIVVFI